MSNRTNR